MAEPDADPLVGSLVAHFLIEGRLGSGGMGVVYRARDTRLKRPVALKLLPQALSSDPEGRAALLKEARAAATFNHPNVAAIYEVDEHEGRAYIAMELVEGRSVRVLLKDREPLPLELALSIARQVTRALERAHAAGLIHRDLKPDNVMLSEDGTVKLLDFGLAKRSEAATALDDTAAPMSREGLVMGTPGYMAPEQASGQKLDHRADLFSLGVMLYEMLTGTRPFAGATAVELMIAVVRDPAPPLSALRPDLPPELGALVAGLLAKQPDQRPPTASAVLASLDGKLPVASGSNGPLLATQPSLRVVRPRYWLLLLLPLVAGAAVGAWKGLRDRPVVLTDFPAMHATPDATRAYQAALVSLRDGARERGLDSLVEAVRLDPSLAAGHLRLGLYGATRGSSFVREHLAAAVQWRLNLSPRDLTLLAMAEAISEASFVRGDATMAAGRKLRDALPDDPEALFLALVLGFDSIQSADYSLQQLHRILELDPEYGTAMAIEAYVRMYNGETAAALAVASNCGARVPRAEECVRTHEELAIATGHCAEAQAQAQKLIEWDPRDRTAREDLALILASSGAPAESVKAAFDQWVATFKDEPARSNAMHLAALRFAIFTGDFDTASREADEVEALRANEPAEEKHHQTTEVQMELAEELGNWRQSLQLAEAYNRKAAAWKVVGWSWIRVRWLYLARRAGQLSEADFQAEHDRMVKVDAEMEANNPTFAWVNWVYLHASFAETPEDVRAALAAMPKIDFKFPRDMELRANAFLVRAGKAREALPRLREVTSVCRVISDAGDDTWLNTVYMVRAHVALGQALEETGDTPGACAAYAWVIRLWKDSPVRPLSLLKSQERSKALSCP